MEIIYIYKTYEHFINFEWNHKTFNCLIEFCFFDQNFFFMNFFFFCSSLKTSTIVFLYMYMEYIFPSIIVSGGGTWSMQANSSEILENKAEKRELKFKNSL